MWQQKDNTYNEIRRRSVEQWLEEMEAHEDIAVRGGVKVTRDYIHYLQDEIKHLEHEGELKNEYMKKMRQN